MAKRGLYIGAGVGLASFALLGLLTGSFIGGVIGLNIAGLVFGAPLGSSLMPRLIVGASMILGICVTGIAFVAGGSILGWLAGDVIRAIAYGKTEAEDLAKQSK